MKQLSQLQNAECGPSVDQLELQHEVVEITLPRTIVGAGTVTDKQLSVSD